MGKHRGGGKAGGKEEVRGRGGEMGVCNGDTCVWGQVF